MHVKWQMNINPALIVAFPLHIGIQKCTNQHGHHYSKMSHVPNDAKFAYKMSKGVGIQDKMDGIIEYESLASYGHLYFNSKMAKNIIDVAVASSRR